MNRSDLMWYLILAGVVFSIGVEIYQFREIRSLRREAENQRWLFEEELIRSRRDEIKPDVGAIQFLRRGYSIQLEAANYTADGLNLRGYVGNPSNLRLSSLTLNFTAYKPLVEYRVEYLRAARSAPFITDPIGKAQSSPIAVLAPGTKELFEVTIPNVKQTKEGIYLTVSFSGARYGYGLRP